MSDIVCRVTHHGRSYALHVTTTGGHTRDEELHVRYRYSCDGGECDGVPAAVAVAFGACPYDPYDVPAGVDLGDAIDWLDA